MNQHTTIIPNCMQSSATEVLSAISNPIMVTNKELVIRFANDAAMQMFAEIEHHIRKDFPDFSAKALVGKSVDDFHKNPAMQRNMIARLKSTHKGRLKIGGRDLDFSMTPVYVEGTEELRSIMVEWKDSTVEREGKRQIESLIRGTRFMVDEHANGMIHSRIPTDDLSEEYKAVADSVYDMVQGHISTKKKIMACMQAFADGDFDYEFEQLSGDRGFINEAIENTRDALKGSAHEIARIASDLASGKMDIDIRPDDFKGGYRDIMASMEDAVTGLNQTMVNLKEQITQVSATISQINGAAQSLSDASQSQSTAVDEISATIEETDQMVQSTSDSTDRMAEIVSRTTELTKGGLETVGELSEAMNAIKGSSDAIAKIIKSIDEIAFQTNLLALNAAVEAARAGQHGRGFAVVAQEVRDLAGRSAKAAKETSDLITTSSRDVARGVEASNASAQVFQQISDEVITIDENVVQIRASNREQASGVQQINTSASDLARTGLELSAQSQELAAAAEEMESSTQMMQSMINEFQLADIRRKTQAAALSDGFSLDGLTPELKAQLMAMLAGQQSGQTPAATHGAPVHADNDPRGYKSF